MENFVVGNILFNGVMLGTIAYLGKRVVDGITVDIKYNREESRQASKEIKESIDKLAEHVAITNGKVISTQQNIALTQKDLEIHITKCEVRNEDYNNHHKERTET